MINLSNHPTHTWPAEMVQAAIAEDGISEIPWFPSPHVEPDWSDERIEAVASAVVAEIVAYNEELSRRPDDGWRRHHTVYVDGETVMAAVLASKLQDAGFTCVVARSPRLATENPDGSITYRFEFRGFRRWPRLKLEHWW